MSNIVKVSKLEGDTYKMHPVKLMGPRLRELCQRFVFYLPFTSVTCCCLHVTHEFNHSDTSKRVQTQAWHSREIRAELSFFGRAPERENTACFHSVCIVVMQQGRIEMDPCVFWHIKLLQR